MKKPLDRITEAYYDNLGNTFGLKVRKRIHWICKNAEGESILDVGCSQGITSILLGREGKKVLGIDLLQESIDYANQVLENESEVTKKYVEFKVANFMDYDFNDEKFDSIIMGEILEHITDPKRFIRKALTILKEKGKLIITVPFGINDYFDHKETYYLAGLLDLTIDGFVIEEIEFFGKWIGIILRKESNEGSKGITLDSYLLGRLEEAFYIIERQQLDTIQNLKNQVGKLKVKESELVDSVRKYQEISKDYKKLKDVNDKTNTKLKEIEEELKSKWIENKEQEEKIVFLSNRISELAKLIDEMDNKGNDSKQNNLVNEIEQLKLILSKSEAENKNLTKELKNKEKEIAETNKRLELYSKELINSKTELVKVRKNKVKVHNDLLASYKKEGLLLNNYKQLKLNHTKLEKMYKNLSRKYEALSNSKLGKFTLSYWKWRKQRVRR